jgi:hypothetical protein
VLSKYLASRYELTIVHADPRELRVEGDEVTTKTLASMSPSRLRAARAYRAGTRARQAVDAMRLFRQNRVVSSMVGDFDHKSCFELLTDSTIAERLFSAEERRLFRRHVLRTRVVGPRKTTLPHEAEGDLWNMPASTASSSCSSPIAAMAARRHSLNRYVRLRVGNGTE